jgi:hypothetical protein
LVDIAFAKSGPFCGGLFLRALCLRFPPILSCAKNTPSVFSCSCQISFLSLKSGARLGIVPVHSLHSFTSQPSWHLKFADSTRLEEIAILAATVDSVMMLSQVVNHFSVLAKPKAQKARQLHNSLITYPNMCGRRAQ